MNSKSSLLMLISHVVLRNGLTGLRSGWQHPKPSIPSTFDSGSEPAQVNQFNYAADYSENDKKEASSMHIFKPNISFAKAKTALPFALCER